jgi:uncharacterized protein (UPF0333 family)
MFLDNKGQASAEFIFITLIVIVIIGGLVNVIGSNQDKTQIGDLGGANALGQKIAETINTVYINGNGYTIMLDLKTLNQAMSSTGNPFSITAVISNSTGTGIVSVTTGGSTANVNLIPTKINGTLNLNNNNVYQVKNVNGTVQIS